MIPNEDMAARGGYRPEHVRKLWRTEHASDPHPAEVWVAVRDACTAAPLSTRLVFEKVYWRGKRGLRRYVCKQQ